MPHGGPLRRARRKGHQGSADRRERGPLQSRLPARSASPAGLRGAGRTRFGTEAIDLRTRFLFFRLHADLFFPAGRSRKLTTRISPSSSSPSSTSTSLLR